MIGRLSLQQRVVAAGLIVVVVVLSAVAAVVFASLRTTLREEVGDVLDARVELTGALANVVAPEDLVAELAARGVPAELVVGQGAGPQVAGGVESRGMLTEIVTLDDGRVIAVHASLAVADATASRLLALLLGTSLAGVLLAALLLLRASRTALGRLEDVVAAARTIAEGEAWARLDITAPGTELGRLEHAFDDMVDVLERSLDEAKRSNEATQRFLADAAHQLRTPVAGIRASAELLVSGSDEIDGARLLDNIVQEAERISRLVSALLRMAHIDQGEPPVSVEADLVDLCRAEVGRAAGNNPAITLELVVGDPPPAPIDLDPGSLAEALANLLDNATRHARERVTVDIRGRGADLLVTVADDGPGMDPETAERAFERFSRFDRCGGAGLGLPIARGIVEAHGGTLDYEPGAFVVRLPRERRRRPRPAVVAAAPSV